MKKTAGAVRVPYPIGFKLMFIISVLLGASLGAITVLVSSLVSQDVRITAENTNFSANTQAASAVESFLSGNRSEATILLHTLGASFSGGERNSIISYFFAENNAVAAVITGGESFINEEFFLEREADSSPAASFFDSRPEYLARAAAGEMLLLNGSPDFEIPILVMLLPDKGGSIAVFLSSDPLAQNFGESANTSFLINSEGDVLIHPDQYLVRSGTNYKDKPFIKSMWERGDQRLQNLYTDDDGARYFGAYTKLSMANSAVITVVEYGVVFEGIAATTRRNIWLSAGVLCLSVLCVWFFSKSISAPLKNLSRAAERIKEGKFNIELHTKNRDEIGLLTESFVEMGKGLAERERLKDTFGRFINREIAERAMKGELKLGGETKFATVFFSDIRDFTAIAEKMPPQDVVGFLNTYFVRMVACITKTSGVVDKYIGDSIMAIWGAPVSTGNPARDALSCVRSALMMRVALQEYNQTRGSENRPYLKIGCGINSGDVVAGQIGSPERMEYTVIGDTVNLASRTEALNKPFGTDILISENTWKLVKDYIISEEMPGVTVKGKEEPVRMFAVVNLRTNKPGAEQPGPVSLAELRGQLGIAAPDPDKINISETEIKYKIHG
ncbi:MAG: HAMP domain-containing protein [Treponema sp.]|jgi:adenylate cyclase|nr:HAMP domain-containing protein [Treponema sp.]